MLESGAAMKENQTAFFVPHLSFLHQDGARSVKNHLWHFLNVTIGVGDTFNAHEPVLA